MLHMHTHCNTFTVLRTVPDCPFFPAYLTEGHDLPTLGCSFLPVGLMSSPDHGLYSCGIYYHGHCSHGLCSYGLCRRLTLAYIVMACIFMAYVGMAYVVA